MYLFTDASGSEGWGTYWSGKWLQARWTPIQQSMDITWKELYAIVTVVHTWRSCWECQKILFHCDNKAVVDIWKKGSTCAPLIMALARLLYFCTTHHNINICIVHVPGIYNDIVDSLSCLQMERFRTLAPEADLTPDNIPAWPMQSFMDASCNATIMV